MESMLVHSSRIAQQLALQQEYQKHKEFYVIPPNSNAENFLTIIGTIVREVFDYQFCKNQTVNKIQQLIMSIVQRRQISLDLLREIYQKIQNSQQKLKQYQQYQKQMHCILLQNEEDQSYMAVGIDQFELYEGFKNKVQSLQNSQEHSESMIKNIEHFDDMSLNKKGRILSDQMKDQGYDNTNLDIGQQLEDQIMENARKIASKQPQEEGKSQRTYKVNHRKQDEEAICKESIILSTKNQSTAPSSRFDIREINYHLQIRKKESIKQEVWNNNSECDNSSQKTVKPKGAKKNNPFGYSPKDKKNSFKFIIQTQFSQSSPIKTLDQNSNEQIKQQKQGSTNLIDKQLQKSNSSRQLKDLNKKVRPSVLNDTSFSNIKQIMKKEHQEDVKKCIQKKIQFEQSGSIQPVNYDQQLKTIRLRHKLNTKKANNRAKN